MRRWPRAVSSCMPRRTPPTSSATTASISAPTAGRSMHTTGVPPATMPARYDWSAAVGTTSNAITRRSTIAITISASRSERSRVDAERMKRSPPPMTASTPCSTPVQNGSPTLGRDHADHRGRAAGAQQAGELVRAEAELLGGAADAGDLVGSHVGLVVEGARHRLGGDPGADGDVGDRRRPTRRRRGHRTSSRAEGGHHRRIGVAGDGVGDRGCGVGDALAHGQPRRVDRARGPRAWRRAARRRHRSG